MPSKQLCPICKNLRALADFGMKTRKDGMGKPQLVCKYCRRGPKAKSKPNRR